MLKSSLNVASIAIVALVLLVGGVGKPLGGGHHSVDAATVQQKAPPVQSPSGPGGDV